MTRPTLETDAYEDSVVRDVPLIFLAGPIKHWWTCWGSPEHEAYVTHRDAVRATLIETGYLTYAPWDAIKGTWSPRAQSINDAGIRASNLMVVLTPPGIPAEGTDDEVDLAQREGVHILHYPPGIPPDSLGVVVAALVGYGVEYS